MITTVLKLLESLTLTFMYSQQLARIQDNKHVIQSIIWRTTMSFMATWYGLTLRIMDYSIRVVVTINGLFPSGSVRLPSFWVRKVLVFTPTGFSGMTSCVAGLVPVLMTFGIHTMTTGRVLLTSSLLVVGPNHRSNNIKETPLSAQLHLTGTSIDLVSYSLFHVIFHVTIFINTLLWLVHSTWRSTIQLHSWELALCTKQLIS